MLGNDLDAIINALTKKDANVNTDETELPTFIFSSESSNAILWVRKQASKIMDVFNVEAVLLKFGVSVTYEEMEEYSEISGYIERRHSGWVIGINKYEVAGRQRFTLAHELGHLMFHRNYILKNLDNDNKFKESIQLYRNEDNTKAIEMEANAFAAELLMPSSRFREVWHKSDSLTAVSNIFGVSRYAAQFRAKKLRLQEMKD